jgi:ABC-2 type transport system permease protein
MTQAAPTSHGERPLPRAERTLPLRVEAARQLSRRRTKVALGLMVFVPLLLAIAFQIGGGPQARPGETPFFGDLATKGALNFTLFVLTVATQLLLVFVTALFAGDTIASEANWGSLRYLLALPVPRSRLLRQKLIVALASAVLASLLLVAASLLFGTIAFGWHPATTLAGSTISIHKGLVALAIITAYITASMLLAASLAFLFSTMTDSPLGAVGGALGVIIVSQIIDQVTSLGSLRDVLPSHYAYSWDGVLAQPAQYGDMQRGMLVTLVWSVILLAGAWWNFLRKDITS